jgi:hypothetical protein
MPAFPAYAVLLFDGFKEEPVSAVKRTEMESGPVKQLKTVSRVLVPRPARYLLKSKSDYNAWVTWFRSTINWGNDWFDWTDPHDAAIKTARIVGAKYAAKPTRKDLERWILEFRIETWSA